MKKYFFFVSIIFLASCDQLGLSSEGKKDPNLKRTFYDNGKLKAEVRIDDDGKRHGKSVKYYPSGTAKSMIVYNHGNKEKATQYYQDGNVRLEYFYKDGKKDSVRNKYWENGKIQSKLEYKSDKPGKGLEEWTKSGKKITKYPDLIVKQIDRLDTHGEYIIEVYFSKNSGRGNYYVGELEDGKFLPEFIEEIERSNGKGRIVLRPAPSEFLMRKVNFIGKYKTVYGNTYITEKSANIAVEY